MSDTLSPTEFSSGDVAEGIERIRRRLLDLSNRNRLLNFRPTRKSSLRVVDELPDQLFDVLSDGREFTFDAVPKPRRDTALAGSGSGPGRNIPPAAEYAATVGISTSFDLPDPPVDNGRAPRHADRAIQTLHYTEELEALLRSLTSAAKLAIEETGSNMLYLVLGFLDWYESDQSHQPRSAPLILFPVALERGSTGVGSGTLRYSLRHSGEDVFANLCLQEKLKQDFGLVLPDLEAEEYPEAYFARISRLVAEQERWAVRRQATVTLLSFGKMLMYRDLDSRNWPHGGGPAAHPLVRGLFEGRRHEHAPTAHDYRIDELEGTSRLPVLIDDADSSQHSVLVDAREGQNLVVAGPPGTGKSQTITNLIAAALSEGKRVLFVSEKLAALEVVRHRLDRAGLGSFCLELHSHKTQKKALIEDLRTRLSIRGRFSRPVLLEEKLETLKTYKRELGSYVDLIGRRFGKFNQTVHELLWTARRRRSALPVQSAEQLDGIVLSDVEAIGLAGFEQLRGRVTEYVTHLANITEGRGAVREHPWFGVSAHDLGFRDEQRVVQPLADLLSSCRDLEVLLKWVEDTGVAPERTSAWLLAMVAPIDALRTSTDGLIPELLALLDDGPTRAILDQFCARVRRYRALHAEIEREWASVPELSAADARSLAARAVSSGRDLPSVYDLTTLRSESARVQDLAAMLRACTAASGMLERAIGHFPAPCFDTLPLLLQSLQCVAATPFEVLTYRSLQLTHDGAALQLKAAEEAAKPIREARAELATRMVLDLAPPPKEARRYAAAAANARWWKPFDAEWRAARRALSTMSSGDAKVTPSLAKAEFQRLSIYLEKVRVFESHDFYKVLCGTAFRGIDTPFVELEALAHWHARLRLLGEHGVVGETLAQRFWNTPSERLRALGVECASDSLLVRSVLQATGAFEAIRCTLHHDHHPSADLPFPAVATMLDAVAARNIGTADALNGLGIPADATLKGVEALLQATAELRVLEAHARASEDVRAILGPTFAGTQTELGPLFRTSVFHDEVRGSALPVNLQNWLLSATATERLAALRKWAMEVRRGMTEMDDAWTSFAHAAKVQPEIWYGEPRPTLAAIAARADLALSARHLLPSWFDYQRARKAGYDACGGRLIQLAESGALPRGQVVAAFEFVFANSLVRRLFDDHPKLAYFSGLTHEDVRSRFAALDRETIALERQRIAAAVDARPVPHGNDFGMASSRTELALLEREAEKQTRHIPIRQLVRRAGKALQTLKPCFMMGPLSVAQYLEPGALDFDLVVMDEASQLRPEDALGAICRGKQMVIVGDPMQLPPTSFFDRIGDSDDDVDEDDLAQAMAEAESILDIARSVHRPTRMLRWHYRSQHGDLIAFSNREFYENELVVFPSPMPRGGELGVRFVHVTEGRFEGRRNVAEARRVVDAISQHAREYPADSLGIVTLNLNQREVIENELEQRLAEDPALQRFVERHRETLLPLFVKNLENVQGDERDVIFISVTYGPDRHGNVFQRFGPINGPMGHRRLNVLFTRAKKRVVVFSSLLAEHVRATEESSWGMRALKGYLHFAQTGILEQAQSSGREPDSDFEIEVAQLLRTRGYEVVAQVGVAGFFIDLAVKHPLVPDRFLLGIECDGATYHSSRSARDRDRLREEILKALGWKLERIWSTDWFRSPDSEVERIASKIDLLLKEDRARVALSAPVVAHPESEPAAPPAPRFDLTPEQAREALVELRESTRVENPDVPLHACILRDAMVDAFLRYRPTNRTEWQDRIPIDLRIETEPDQAKYLERIFEVLALVS